MSTDGGLRQIFRQHVIEAHWQAIETGGVGTGIPDMNYCIQGCDGWIEAKRTTAWALAHPIQPEQVSWPERRVRCGGRYLLAVRKQHAGGSRLGVAIDELYIFGPEALRLIAPVNSIRGVTPRLHCTGGPARWDWDALRALMKERPR